MILSLYTALGVEVAVQSAGTSAWAASDKGALESTVDLLERALAELHAGPKDVSLVGVCTGPGSFTGLRIGVAFAKSFAQARGLPIVGVSSYDIEALGAPRGPLLAVARGKPGYYYARLSVPGDSPRFVHGDRETMEQAARSTRPVALLVGPDFTEKKAGEAALAVARLAQQAFVRDPHRAWTDVAIDYGQRPNAEVNWERRQARAAGGPEVLPREPKNR
ncbi:MAG TPA: tRNA (adenosine(37)-N6)-threonylcarbamoyltransferase complex dimerization subunit type 1 TsaB [Candidatus Acidoferrales bacterium]|nr:tRNA (adenosine(37)-N6)-threonylcarbamoyltransferase complex dimerization subunit type 1 TsaB [Candidatus Acidoferrales bacterium]